jgi:hypothetical protein
MSVVDTDAEDARLADNPIVVGVSDPLPRIFTQDWVVSASEEESLEELVYGDLRRGVFVEEGERFAVSGEQSGEDSKQLAVSGKQSEAPGTQLPLTVPSPPLTAHRLPITDYSSFQRDPGSIKHFNELQVANTINELDLSNPNRVQLTIDINIPSMVVMTDVWHPDWSAEVDGHPAVLFRVNYLQRGLWLEKGIHKVIMTFVPGSWKIGRWGTISGVFIALVMIIFRRGGSRKI